jgi:hypothetical protein
VSRGRLAASLLLAAVLLPDAAARSGGYTVGLAGAEGLGPALDARQFSIAALSAGLDPDGDAEPYQPPALSQVRGVPDRHLDRLSLAWLQGSLAAADRPAEGRRGHDGRNAQRGGLGGSSP